MAFGQRERLRIAASARHLDDALMTQCLNLERVELQPVAQNHPSLKYKSKKKGENEKEEENENEEKRGKQKNERGQEEEEENEK